MASSQLLLILLIVSNSIVHLTAQYQSILGQGNRLETALRHPFELKCKYTGVGGDGEFLGWFKQNATHDVSVNTDKPGHYIVKDHDRESSLLIKIFVNADANVTRWYVKTKSDASACQFGQISLIPSPQGIEDNKGTLLDSPHGSIRRTEDQDLNLKCLIVPMNPQDLTRIQWQFSPDNKTYTDLLDGIEKHNDEIQINSVRKFHRGYYRCTLNRISFTILLRVKDRLAALWPFIGIIGIVLILVIIIIIFERRQKSNRRQVATDDDEQDHATDPLVRTTIKSSDNDNKKRAVKA